MLKNGGAGQAKLVTLITHRLPERAEKLFAESEAAAKAVEGKAATPHPTDSLFRVFRPVTSSNTCVFTQSVRTKSIKKSKSVGHSFTAFPSPYERLKKLA